MYKKLLLLIITICAASFSIAQSVGINTNDPTATLDIEATNPAAPDSTTGILIPRIDAFPLSNPSIDQNGMMVFLTTDNKFYFWNNATLTWVPVQTGIDLDNDPSNELQALDFSGTTLGISDGSTVSLSSIGGDITSVTAGAGITGGGTAGTVTVTANANNGLNVDAGADRIQLGGALTENTTITQGTNTMDFTTTEVDGFSVDGATFSVDGTNNRIGIGTASPNSTMQIVNSTTTNSLNIQSTSAAVVGQVLNIQRTNDPSPANDILQITTPSTSPDDFQFLEFDRGGNVEFAVDGDGDVEFNGALEPNGAPGTSGQFLRSAGTNASPTWATIPGFNGDITGITAGDGLVGGGTTGTVTVNVVATNGLTDNANDVRLGGTLIQATTITQGVNNMTFNLNNTGDFTVQDNGTDHFQVRDDGLTFFGDDTYWRDGSTNGTNLAILSDDGDDGRFRIYENGITSVDLDANTQFVFNEQGLDRDFRIETDIDANAFRVNAGTNRIGIGDASPTTRLEIAATDGQSLMLSRQDAAIVANDQLGGIGFDGSDGNTPDNISEASAAIIAFASETQGTGDKGGRLTFWTSPTNQDDDTDGFERLRIDQDGTHFVAGDMFWRDASVSGTNLVRIVDDGDDGQMIIYENGVTQILLDANGTSVFNEQGLDRNFRVESDANANMFFVDAGTNRVGIGTGVPTQTLDVRGNAVFNDDGGNNFDFRIESDLYTNMFFLDASTNNIGINTAPTALFHITADGTAIGDALKLTTSSGSGDDWYTFMNTNEDMIIRDDGSDVMCFQNGSDRVGINTNAPTANLSVNGTANKPGGGTWAAFSDARLKKGITKYNEGLEFILKVKPVNFSYNDKMKEIWGEKTDTKTVYQGVIAQDLQKIAPDMVKEVTVKVTSTEGGKIISEDGELEGGITVTNEEQFFEVDPNKFTYALINAVKELNELVEKQQEQINQLLLTK